MALEWLKPILGEGYTDDVDARIAQEIGKGFVARADFNAKNEELKQVNTLLKTHEAQLETLKSGDAEKDAKITALQEQNRQDKAAHEAEIAQIRLDAAVDKALTDAGAKNNTAARALLDRFLKDAKVDEDGTVRGLASEIEALAKAEGTAFMFGKAADTQQPLIHGMKPGEAADGGLPAGAVNPFDPKTLDLEAQGALFKKDPAAARALAKQAGVKFI
jgi:hypothetical protein